MSLCFSFGQPAIFLLGGTSKSQRPHAMYLHSGDIVIMMKESRLAYHAVPRIVSAKHGLPEALRVEDADGKEQYYDEKKDDTDENASQDCYGVAKPSTNEDNSAVGDKNDQSTDELERDPTQEKIVNQRIKSRMREMDITDYVDYMKTCRLNMNVRQVLCAGEAFPDSEQNEVCKKTKVT